MRPARVVLASMLVAAAAAACAMPPPEGPAPMAAQGQGQCFRASQVTGFSDAGPDVALVNIGFRESWELALSPGCPNVDYAMKLGIVSRGSTRICSGADAELIIPRASGSGAQRCLIRNVRRLSPEEAAAARGLTPAGR